MSGSGGSNQLRVIIAGIFAMVFLPVVIVIAMILGSIGGLNSPAPCATGQPNQSGTFSYPTDQREVEKGFDLDDPEHPRHAGADFDVSSGTDVKASADGAVLTTSDNIVKIQHPGDIQTWYQYFSEIDVDDGERVTRGKKLGTSGRGDESPHGMRGAHLHFEIRIKDDETQQYFAVDPTGLLSDAPQQSPGTPGSPGQDGGGAPSLMGQATVSAAQLAAWYRSGNRPDPDAQINGPGPSLDDLTRWYVEHGNAENVRGDMAFVQAMHETGNFGNPDSDIFNFAGIGHCGSCPSGSPFGSAEDGVIGHLQLLKRVANGNSIGFALPTSPNLPQWGGRRISTWNQMGGGNGAWASDPNYWNALSRLAGSLWQHAGVQPPGGGADGCGGGGGGTIVETALNLAWDTPGHGPYDSDAKPTYQQAMPQYNGSVGSNPFSDCGVFVATVMHMTGADPQYPKRDTEQQQQYVQSHPEKYEVFTNLTNTSQLQPGDIFLIHNGSSGHTYIYTGDYQGGNGQRYNAASASLNGHVPEATNTYFSDSRGHYIVARLKART